MITINKKPYPFNAIVFLDIDGVLNSNEWFKSETCQKLRKDFLQSEVDDDFRLAQYKLTQIDPEAVIVLNQILIKFNLGIVLSSTWRKVSFCRLALELSNIDRYKERLLGVTPRLRGKRGEEIHDWITKNKYDGAFFILDDDGDMEPYMEKLIQTDFMFGLTPDHSIQIKSII